MVKKPPAMQEMQETWEADPWVGKIPSRRAWQPTPVSLLGKSHGQRSLVGYGLWGCKEWDMTEATARMKHDHRQEMLCTVFRKGNVAILKQ